MQANRHIAFIVNGGVYSGFQSEGTPVLTQLLTAISEHYQVTVFSLTSASSEVAPFHLLTIDGKGLRKYINLYRAVKKVNRRRPIDLFHGFFGWPAGFFSVVLSRLFSKPSVITLMGGESTSLPTIKFGMLDKPHLKRLIFWSIKKASATVVLSQYQKNSLISHGLSAHSNLQLIPFGIQFNDQHKEVLPKAPYELIVVANINLIKNHRMIIRALKVLRQRLDVHLKVIGGDFLDGQIQEFTEQEGLAQQVSFIGQVSNDKVKQLIVSADAMVIASYSESFAVVFVEAMMMGLPVCSTPVGLMQELAGTHCLICEIDDHKQMADQLYKLLTQHELRTKLIRNGKAWAKSYDLTYTMSEYGSLYNNLIGK